jgi:peptidoglycan hydrolase CwlO-like protein
MDTAPSSTTPSAAPDNATATAPETPVAASPAIEAPKKKGFLGNLLGANTRAEELETQLVAEQAAHAQTQAALEEANGRIAEFEALEAQLEQQAAAAEKATTDAQAAQANAEAEIPKQVSAKVIDIVSGLGIEEEKLAPVLDTPAAKGEEFSHLKGRDRAAAAFTAQFAK